MQRKSLVIFGIVLLVVGFGVSAFFLTRNTASSVTIAEVQSSAVIVPFTKLIQGKQSVIDRRVNYVLTSPTQLSELWKTVAAPGKPPKVDFKTHAVIAVFAGKEPSSTITIAKIEDTNTRMVSIAITKPDGACAQKQLVASPYEIVAVSATSLPLAHEDVSVTSPCTN